MNGILTSLTSCCGPRRPDSKKGASGRERLLSSTDQVGKLAGIPVIAQAVNAGNRSKLGRKLLEKTLGVHREATLPAYFQKSARQRLRKHLNADGQAAEAGEKTQGKVLLFVTCYGNRNRPSLAEDLVAVYEHNDIPVALAKNEVCCGMPKLEMGDLAAVEQAMVKNIPQMLSWVNRGWDIVTPVPSCTLMFKQELPLMFPNDPDVSIVRDAMYDPFEYLMLRHKEGRLNAEFPNSLGKITYQVPCHLRVQNIGLKTRDLLHLVPDTEVAVIERCSGHDGTYALKKEFHAVSRKIAGPVIRYLKKSDARHFVSDCPMAAEQISAGPGRIFGRASAGLVTQGLRHLALTKMQKLTRKALFSLEKYAEVRENFRAEVMRHKRHRRLGLGENATLYFEDNLTMQYQVQEMLRIERIFEATGIDEELAAYNPLIPDGSNWKATFMIEFPEVDERDAMLRKLGGIEDCVWLEIGRSGQDPASCQRRHGAD